MMKIKEIKRTANVAWSPFSHHPIYLAAATAAQQLDSSFSTNACLELFKLDFDDASEPDVCGSITTDDRLHKLVWSPMNSSDSGLPELLIGGAGQGRLYIWNPNSVICQDEPLVYLLDKHIGAVSALDINPFQVNLLASGAGNSEIFIWDLKNPEKPMTPGSKAQPVHDVVCLAWNRQVQHILSSSQDGNCIVWDLRKNEPIIQIRDGMSRMKSSLLCWHPDVATQLCIASEDDHTPAIQLWDLRSATSPVKQFEGHNRGILSLAWCPQDSGLLLSCGKDNRILCWNPNSSQQNGEVVYELPNSNQWCFDVQWCPRSPGIVSGCSFDGHVSIYSINQGSKYSADRVVDSFSLDGTNQSSCSTLKFAPKWLKRPCGASFGFGGKLVAFSNLKMTSNSEHWTPQVTLSQVVTEPLLVMRAMELEEALNTNSLINFCDKKLAEVDVNGEGKDSFHNVEIWNFLKVSLEEGSQEKYLKLFNYNGQESEELHIDCTQKSDNGLECQVSCQNEKTIERDFLKLRLEQKEEELVTRALLRANFHDAVEVCMENGCLAEALMLAYVGGQTLFLNTQQAILRNKNSKLHKLISAIINHDIESVVNSYELSKWKEILLIIISYAFPQELQSLCNLLGKRLQESGDPYLNMKAQLCFVVAGNVEQLIINLGKNIESEAFHRLQDVIEKVTILQHSQKNIYDICHGNILSGKLTEYADTLAGQGCSLVALRYLTSKNDLKIAILKDRIFCSLGREYTARLQPPPKPFHVIDIKSHLASQKQYQQSFHQAESFKISQQLASSKIYQSFSSQLQPSHNVSPPIYTNNSTLCPTNLHRGIDSTHNQLCSSHSLYNPIATNSSVGSSGYNLPSGHDKIRTGSQLCNKPSKVELVGTGMYQGQLYNPQDFPPAINPSPSEQIAREEPTNYADLPQEHRIIKEVFDETTQRCFAKATNALTRKKLDDICKRLIVLYTRLREGSVSPTIASGIHQIVACLQRSDYDMALAYHTQIVGMGNFSEISSFFPSIKILIHTASQLGISLQ